MPRTRPMIDRGGPIDGIVEDARSELESLKEELEEWRDNMDSNNMSHMPKYDELCEAIDQLDSALNYESSMPDVLLPGMENAEYRWQEKAPYKGTPSRATRHSNAVNDLSIVVAYLDDVIGNVEDSDAAESGLLGEWEQYRDGIQSLIDDAESVEFPGMY